VLRPSLVSAMNGGGWLGKARCHVMASRCSSYGANRLKRVPVGVQNVMLYVIRNRVPNYAKIYSGGLLFKSHSNLGFCTIVFILNIMIETIVICNIYYYWALKCLISYCYLA